MCVFCARLGRALPSGTPTLGMLAFRVRKPAAGLLASRHLIFRLIARPGSSGSSAGQIPFLANIPAVDARGYSTPLRLSLQRSPGPVLLTRRQPRYEKHSNTARVNTMPKRDKRRSRTTHAEISRPSKTLDYVKY